MSQSHTFLVGTFNTPQLYTLQFTPPSKDSTSGKGSLRILHCSSAIGSHSWLHLSPPRHNGTQNLYATAWTDPPSVVAYAVDSPTKIRLLGSAQTQSRSGYVCASDRAVYSAGGATGEVFSLDAETGNFASPTTNGVNGGVNGDVNRDVKVKVNGNGNSQRTSSSSPCPPPTSSLIQPLQTISFLDSTSQRDDGSVMDFGGLRHGAHSADLSPSGHALYVADIGRNCIWSMAVSATTGALSLPPSKHISPRPTDGPRHVWPHPSGTHVYCLQEHTSMVDVFSTGGPTHSGNGNGNLQLKHKQGVRIIPPDEAEGAFWADEVRTSLSHAGQAPEYLYASTRGLTPEKKGYVAVYKLTETGSIDTDVSAFCDSDSDGDSPNGNANRNGQGQGYKSPLYAGLLCMYQTATSGGWANAVQPGPTVDGVEYLALTDSEEGWVFVLGWDGRTGTMTEAARVRLDEGAGAATAVWL